MLAGRTQDPDPSPHPEPPLASSKLPLPACDADPEPDPHPAPEDGQVVASRHTRVKARPAEHRILAQMPRRPTLLDATYCGGKRPVVKGVKLCSPLSF